MIHIICNIFGPIILTCYACDMQHVKINSAIIEYFETGTYLGIWLS